MSIYAFSLSAMLGTSALYHRVTWTPEVRQWMRRLDHTMIFVFIAGTYTPFALLVMHGTLANVVLIVVWATAAARAGPQSRLDQRALLVQHGGLPEHRLGRDRHPAPALE